MIRLSAPILLFAALAAAAPARAAEGSLTAFACGTMPSPLRVAVEAAGDTVDYQRLRGVLVAALRARDAVVADDAPLTLSFSVEAVREQERRKGRDLGQFSTGNRSDERTRFRMNLWSNRQDSVLGGRRDQILYQGVNELHVVIAIHDKRDGRCVWQGEAQYQLGGRDEDATARHLIPLLADQLGRSVRSLPLQLDD